MTPYSIVVGECVEPTSSAAAPAVLSLAGRCDLVLTGARRRGVEELVEQQRPTS